MINVDNVDLTKRRTVSLLAITLTLMAMVLSGCATTPPVPVTQRPIPTKPRPAAVAKPDTTPAPKADAYVVVKPLAVDDIRTYTVRSGDTMFGIAKANNVSVRDLAAWNNISDPANISVGQVLRLSPPDGVAVKPLEVKPVTGAPDDTTPVDANLKTQPLGQRVPYSDQALAQMSKGAAKHEPKPEPKSVPEAARGDGSSAWIWPTQGKLIRQFNDSTSKGIAIAGTRGQPVHAAAAGLVIFSGTGLRGMGRLVVIRHNVNFLSVYAHNDRLLVKEGQNVTQGQRIAEMGNTDTDSVKLHFEIRRQGKPVDPLKLLPDG